MDVSRGRRRKRKHIVYDDVDPSTDLPPLVEGELRCFLYVTIGELAWGTTATHKVPPASPVYIRLRWWGEATNGTYFRPSILKSHKTVKSRSKFGIRSGPKQISAYFSDMGSATFDVLSSPTSLPIGRVLVPGVSSLSSTSPIRGYFPIVSASSRKLGELQISISFKPLRAAYEETSDTLTDGSFSARSRTSLGGRGSRQSSKSRASSLASSKSRSSSHDRRSNSRSASGSKRSKTKKSGKKLRSRSRSTESRVSFDLSQNEAPTPRGVDKLLEQNGHDLYGRNEKPVRNSGENPVEIRTTVSMSRPTDTNHADAIGELLKRGRKLRNEINQARDQNPTSAYSDSRIYAAETVTNQVQTQPAPALSTATTTVSAIKSAPVLTTAPVQPSKKNDLDMRILDMVFKAKGLKDIDFASPDASGVTSPHRSLVSDLDDPLHDDSILQQLFYNQANSATPRLTTADAHDVNSSANNQTLNASYVPYPDPGKVEAVPKTHKVPASPPPTNILAKLDDVNVARVSVHGLQLAPSLDLPDELSRSCKETSLKKREKGKRGKPPVSSSPFSSQNFGRTFFVEYKFPNTVTEQRSIAVITSNHELTRVASRKLSKTGLVKFDQHSHFNIRFNHPTLDKWSSEHLEFVVYQKRHKDKKATILGVGTMPLRDVISSPKLSRTELVRLSPRTSDSLLNSKNLGTLKVSIELVGDAKDLPTQMSPSKKPAPSRATNPYTVTKNLVPERDVIDDSRTFSAFQRKSSSLTEEGDFPQVCVEDKRDAVEEEEESNVCPRLASTVLYLYIMLERGRNIPATKTQSGAGAGKSCPPNVYLVCRTFASDEASRTPVVWNSSNPCFGFAQVVPVKINKQLFSRLRNNFVVVEVWTKIPHGQKLSDKLMGLVKIPLHLFYQSLKDPEVARAVLKSEYPLVSVDGFQPIVDVFTGNERGQLKLLLALGTQVQVNAMRKTKGIDDKIAHHLNKTNDGVDNDDDDDRKDEENTHSFQISIHGLRGFEPHNTQVWGETDCFLQYQFPAQRQLSSDDEDADYQPTSDKVQADGVSLDFYRSDTTLCIPNPQFNFTKQHLFKPPPSVPLQNLLLSPFSSSGETPPAVNFEVWSRFYYPNVRDQLLAKNHQADEMIVKCLSQRHYKHGFRDNRTRDMSIDSPRTATPQPQPSGVEPTFKSLRSTQGSLPLAKLTALVALSEKRVTEQSFQVPLKFVETETGPRSAGDVNVTIKYKSSRASKQRTPRATFPFFKNVKIQVAVLRACGLQAAAKLKATLVDDDNLQYCSQAGVNSCVKIRASFLPSEKSRQTRCVARSFTPDYNHQFEFDCSVISHDDGENPTSLAAQLASGEIVAEVWHKPVVEDIDGNFNPAPDLLLGRIQIPTCNLLYMTTGCGGWYSVTSMESLQHRSSSNVGAVEIAASFTCRSDLDLVLRAAKAVGWAPALKTDLNRLLVPSSSGVLMPIDNDDLMEDSLTTCITVTNAWLPRSLLVLPGTDEVNKNTHIFLRYKFYDKDTVISTVCPVASASERKTFKELDVFPVKLAHRKSFLCRATQPLIWYLREENLEVQVWLSYSRSSRSRKRPFDYDKLLGTATIDMSSVLVGGLHRQQHISGLYPLYKAGVDDLGDASLRVYLSVNPGDHTQPLDLEELDETSATLSSTDACSTPGKDDDRRVPRKRRNRGKFDSNHFGAVVSVERAMHLSSLPVAEPEVQLGCYVTYPVAGGDKTVEMTKVVPRSACPVWDDAREVKLDRKVLDKDHGSLLFRVWQRDEKLVEATKDDESQESIDKVIGFATVDVSLLLAGFRAVNGWYNVLDIHGHCQGQIKVAITPTDAMYVNQPCESQKSPSTLQIPSSPHKGILHSVPLWGPVETPSGSMYVPGVAKTSKDRRKNGSKKEDPPVSSSHTLAPNTTTAPGVSIDSMPRRALFQHDTQSSLQSVLRKQMMELDQIKDNFQKRLRDAFGTDPDNSPVDFVPPLSVSFPTAPRLESFPSTSMMTHHSKAVTSDEVFPQSPPSVRTSSPPSPQSETTVPPVTVPSEPELIFSAAMIPSGVPFQSDLGSKEMSLKLNSSTPEFTRSVHLSLFKSSKMADYNDGALSDNDLSDVEFVQPRSLNDEENLPDVEVRSAASEIGTYVKESEESFPTSLIVTPPQTTPSERPELDNTSLWLSASTSQLENHSKTEVDAFVAEEEEDTVVKELISSDPPIQLFDEERVHEPEAVNQHDEKVEASPPCLPDTELSVSIEEDEARVHDEEDDEGSDSTIKNEDEVHDSDTLPTVPFKQQSESNSKGKKDLLDESEDNSDDEKPIPEEQIDDSRDEIVRVSSNVSATFKSKTTTKVMSSDLASISHPGMNDDLPSTSSEHLPTQPSSSINQIPSFFPPQQDLLASMRALQAVTTEQKCKLLKQEQTENKENSFVSSNSSTIESRPRRKILRPATHTTEQIERLARIFSTKYST